MTPFGLRLPQLFGAMALLASVGSSAQAPRATPPSSPSLLIFTRPRPNPEAERALALCLDEDVLVAWGLRGELRSDPKGVGGGAAHTDASHSETNPLDAWVLRDPRGQSLASGPGLPTPEGLHMALTSSGFKSPILELRRFLASHPRHGEATRDLLLELVRCAELRRARAPSQGLEALSESEDRRLWGDLPRVLGELLDLPEAASGWVDLSRLLPAPQVLQGSPRLRSVLARHRPTLAQALVHNPDNGALWANLLHLDLTLGSHATLDLLAEVAWLPVPAQGYPELPYLSLAQQLARSAAATGRWEEASRGFAALWEQGAKIKLRFYGKDFLVSTRPGSTPAEAREAGRAERRTFWEGLLVPWIQSLCRAGRPGAVSAVLAELDQSWWDLDLPARLARLSEAEGLPEHGRAWIQTLRTLPEPLPEGLPLGPGFVLFHQAQPPGGPGPAWELALQNLGLRVGCRKPSDRWKRRLAWPEASPRWALLDGSGTIRAQGERWPSKATVVEQARPWNFARPDGPLDRLLQVAPDHGPALALRLAHRGGRLCAARSPSSSLRTTPESDDPAEGEIPEDVWPAYVADFHRFFQSPNWRDRHLLDQVMHTFPPLWLLPEAHHSEAQALAQESLMEVEEALRSWPGETTLWMAWTKLAEATGRRPLPLLPLLSEVAVSPLRSPGTWPPFTVLLKGLEGCLKAGRWEEARGVLGPLIEARLATAPPGLGEAPYTWGNGDREALQRLYDQVMGAAPLARERSE